MTVAELDVFIKALLESLVSGRGEFLGGLRDKELIRLLLVYREELRLLEDKS